MRRERCARGTGGGIQNISVGLLAVLSVAVFGGGRAHAIGFTDAEAYASLDTSNLYMALVSHPNAQVDPWFVEVANEYDQGVYTVTFDGVSQYDVAQDGLNSGGTEWPDPHYVTSHSAHPFEPVFSDAASEANNNVMYSIVGSQFGTESYASSYRRYDGIILGDQGWLHVEIPYEINYGTAAVVPLTANIYTEVALSVRMHGRYEGIDYDYTYYDYAYYWHYGQEVGTFGSAADELARLVPTFNGASFELLMTTKTYAVLDDYWYPQGQWGQSYGYGTGSGGEVPEPVSAVLWLGALPAVIARRRRA